MPKIIHYRSPYWDLSLIKWGFFSPRICGILIYWYYIIVIPWKVGSQLHFTFPSSLISLNLTINSKISWSDHIFKVTFNIFSGFTVFCFCSFCSYWCSDFNNFWHAFAIDFIFFSYLDSTDEIFFYYKAPHTFAHFFFLVGHKIVQFSIFDYLENRSCVFICENAEGSRLLLRETDCSQVFSLSLYHSVPYFF